MTQNKQTDIAELLKLAGFELDKDRDPSHDTHHLERVLGNARTIQKKEGGDLLLVELMAVCHDLNDHKRKAGLDVQSFLEQNGYDLDTSKLVAEETSLFSWSRGHTPNTLEGRIAQDADRLEAIGAVGIARCFAFGGLKGRPLQESIQHFHEKLFLVSNRLNTQTARQMALSRDSIMRAFLENAKAGGLV